MSDEKRVRAPYNFVPFHRKNSNTAGARSVAKVFVRYQDISDLPRHDVIDPALKTGEIHVTMRAETPVFVSDGNGHFFRGSNGRFMLPGSTIRGMVRENMQILGFGLMLPGEDMEDYQVYFREMSAARGSTGDMLKQYYRGVLDIESGRDAGGKSYSIPRKVEAGYLRREGNSYYIQPAKAPYIRVPKGNAVLTDAGLSEGYAKTVNVAYTVKNNQLSAIRKSGQAIGGMEQGVLLYTGMPIGGKNSKKHNARYLFPAADEQADRVEITREDELSYQIDWENRKNSLNAYYDSDFWALPREGEEKPVFYVCHDGHTYFGMSLFLRVGYSHKFSEGLPKVPDSKIAWQEGSVPLDYVHAVLGFAGKDSSYRSRVSFGDFPAEGDPKEGPDIRMILGQPKPSWYAGYVEGGKHYNNTEFCLRGYKLYWLKEVEATSVPEDKEKVGSTLRPLPEGTVFKGVIRYKNLHPDELGLLLWSLRLNDGCFQSIGMGKPYGYGRMSLTIDRLLEYDTGALYAPENLCGIPLSGDQNSVASYIEEYDRFACEALHIKKPGKKAPPVSSEDAILDFFYMRSTIRDSKETGYMELPEYKNMKDALPSVQTIREDAEEAKQKTAAPAQDDPNDMDAMLEALRRKFNNN